MPTPILRRYLRKELLPPALLGLCVYTAILAMNLLFQVAELTIRRALPGGLVLQFVGLALPRLLVLTIPVAVLVGVMVGLGRLGSDGEITGLRAMGVGDLLLYRAALSLGLSGWLVSSVLIFWVVPGANYAQHRLAARTVILTDPAREIQPRVFYEKFPGTLLFAEEVPAREPIRRVFLYRSAEGGGGAEEITLARAARIAYDTSGEEVAIEVELSDGAAHAVDPVHPEGYQVTRFASQKVRLPPAPALAARLRLLDEPPPKGLREQSLPELWRTIREFAKIPNPRARQLLTGEATMELHKQFALPCASLVLAILGVPLGLMARRGTRAAGFAVSLGVILFYWILMTVGEDLLRKGVLPSPLAAAWGPNLIFLAAGLVLSFPGVRRRLRALGLVVSGWGRRAYGAVGGIPAPRRRRLAGGRRSSDSGASPLPTAHRRALRLISLIDWLMLSSYVRILLFIGVSAWALYLLVEFKGQIDDLLKNRLPMSLLWEYLEFRSPALLVESVVPVALLVATVLVFSQLSRSGELVALQASGISRRRAAVPLVVLAATAGALSLLASETVLPAASQRADELRAEIRGKRSPRTFYRPERRWVFGEDGRLYSYRRELRGGRILEGFTFLRIDREAFRLAERWQAERAVWDGSAWRLLRGWVRRFSPDGSERFETFEERREALGEDPSFLVQEHQTPAQMNFLELSRYQRDLATAGYDVRELRVALYQRLMTPWVGLVMVILALPLALRAGRQSPLAALGISLALGMVYYAFMNAGVKLGEIGVAHAAVAVWSPTLLFAGAGLWFLGRQRA
jgi:LPS export ABC transporter permease LptG/LPS export ABC transporter permease LptF